MVTPPYVHNFCFPVPEQLQNERVKLTPFIPSEHAEPFFAAASTNDNLFAYLPWGPFASAKDFVATVIDGRIQPDPGMLLFAVFTADELAGIIGLLDTSATNLSTEIGFVITLPRFQRTHVTSNAVGLLLHCALDAPAAGGLGLRRVAWKANVANVQSVRAAERMGFRREGVLRWDRVLPPWKTLGGNSSGERAGDPKQGCMGRDTILLSMCWDDWEGGGRDSVDAIMKRGT
ncbi:acyl-CoA N-acyltransferase [Mycena sp. CBHHK59/15]|nr:acyl-CoA N-acyltransferase [Mycena sp. CBHHK59/15]KAJ6607668.1 acyl-CoA N-acyltransferase [Mycena sp. CBHHK59/15]